MTKRQANTKASIVKKLGLVSAGTLICALGGAFAELAAPDSKLKFKNDYLGYAASISPRVTYTDNVELLPRGFEEDEVIASTLLSASAILTHRRFTGMIHGDLDFSYLTDDGDFRVNQDIGAVGTATVLDNWFYVDVSGTTSRQLLGDNARFSANTNASRNQRADVHTFSVSPYLLHEFADQSSVELRYRFSKAFINDREADVNLGYSDLFNNSQTQEVLAAYESGSLFDRLRFRLSAYGNRTVEKGSDVIPRFEYEQAAFEAAADFALSSKFALVGAVGYDALDTQTPLAFFDDEELSGVYWRAGFAARPGRRTKLRAEYGRRYGDDFLEASLEYDISERLRLMAGASRTFQTRAESNGARFRLMEQDVLDFAQRLRESDGLSVDQIVSSAAYFTNTSFDAQTVGLGPTNDAYIGLRGVYARTLMSLAANYQKSDYGFSDSETIGITFDMERELSRYATLYGRAFYRRAETDVDLATCIAQPIIYGFDPFAPGFDAVTSCQGYADNNGRTNTVGGSIGVAYQIYESLALFGEYSHTERLSPFADLEYVENAVTTGLKLDF